MDCTLVPVSTDGEGLIPGALATLLDNWPAGLPPPKVLYTIPNGQNPSGASMSLDRRTELYALACKYDLIILEDDPYFHLQLDGQHGNAEVSYCTAPPSLHSMDTEGRVMRFDSLSKLMSAGLRLGWVTGPKPLINQLELQFQATMLHASGLSQMIAASLLHQWGPSGFDDHVTATQGLYRARRDAFLTSADRHLTGLAEWTSPSSGMFVWFKVPSIADTQELMEKCRDAKVVFVPGAAFSPTEQPSQYVRACFSLASVDDMDTALERFASLIQSV
jgi:kynurenine/2-aminoadipate aminotransferase